MSTPDLVSVLQRYVLAGFRLQLALRLVLAAFLGTTLVIERPQHRFWLCILILAVYLAIVGAMGGVGVHPTAPARATQSPSRVRGSVGRRHGGRRPDGDHRDRITA